MSREYGTLATEVYELDKPVGRPFADVDYYTGLLADVSGPIFEPATGTGRILIPLLEAGHQVEGLDSSPQMLACCREHCRHRGLDPVLREADMTAFVQLAAYEAVIIPAGSIALLDGRKATLQALTCFRDSLVPGGRLIVDVPASQPATGHEAMRYWQHGSCLWTLQTMHIEYDPAANQTTRFLRYDKWQGGTLRMTELQTFRLQHWDCQEFEDLLAEAGFTRILLTADYKTAASPRTTDGIWTFHATVPQARSDDRQHLRSGQAATAGEKPPVVWKDQKVFLSRTAVVLVPRHRDGSMAAHAQTPVCLGKEENYRQALTFAGHKATIIVDLMVGVERPRHIGGSSRLFTM